MSIPPSRANKFWVHRPFLDLINGPIFMNAFSCGVAAVSTSSPVTMVSLASDIGARRLNLERYASTGILALAL